jgi:tetratricopeptide (TPR) repeat protein
MIAQTYDKKGKEFELVDVRDLAQCCITTSRLVWENDQVLFSGHEYKEQVPLRLEAKFNFPKNVADISSDQYNKSDINAIGEFLKAKNVATSVSMSGFASPEGPYKKNVGLAMGRLGGAKTWLIDQLKAAGYEQYLDSSFFSLKTSAQDWAGFQKGISSYPQNTRDQISEIVLSGLDENEKEKQIMALVGGKDKVEFILAPLRRVTIVMEGFEPRRTKAEITQIAQDFIDGKLEGGLKDKFEKEEWLYAATLFDKPTDKLVLYEAYSRAYASDYRGHNNAGASEILIGNNNDAAESLESANKLNSTDYAVNNNYGVAYKLEKKYKDAKRHLETSLSSQSTPEANFNLGVVMERMGRFNEGVQKFNSASTIAGNEYNAGLCKLMMDDISGAKASLSSAIKKSDDSSGWPHYLMAIAAARGQDPSAMSVNLKKACEIDSKLKEKAPKDLEFRKYWNSPEFKAAVK